MRESGTMNQTVMHCIFVGPAGVGKSSLLKRLLRKKLVSKRTSTQAAEKSLRVEIIRDVTTTTAQVSGFDWKEIENPILQGSVLIGHLSTSIRDPASSGKLTLRPKKQILDPLTRSLEQSPAMQVIKEYHSTTHDPKKKIPEQKGQALASKQQSSYSPQIHSPAQPVTNPSESNTSKSTHSKFKMSLDFFRHVLKEQGVSGLKKHIDNKWTLYLTDSGGQPEFQELLPALVVGPCVFILVFPLNRDLNMKYEVVYERPDEKKYMKRYLSSLTIQEDLLRSLASIAFTKYKDKDDNEVKPRVMLVGTFKDKVTKEDCQKKLKNIKALVTETDAYRQGMIVDASETQMVFTINNYSDDESEKDAQKIRDAFGKFADGFRVHTPAPWLIFSILLQYLSTKGSVVSKPECFAVAKECGIETPSDFEAALQFLHKQTGTLHYYNVSSELSQIVIRNPQHLFSRVNELVEKTFTFEVTQTTQCTNDFLKRGIFRRTDYETYTLAKESSSDKLTPSMLLQLLEHLNVVVSLDNGKKYFMPCAIAHLEPTDISLPPQPALIPPLLVTFKSGYCPKGLFPSLLACIARNAKLDLHKSNIHHNQICFALSQCNLLLRVSPACIYLETNPGNTVKPLSVLCNGFRKMIFNSLDEVCKTLYYSLTAHTDYFLSFEGWCDQCKKLHPLQTVLNVDHLKVDHLKVELFQCNQSQKLVKSSLRWYIWLPEVSRQQHGVLVTACKIGLTLAKIFT